MKDHMVIMNFTDIYKEQEFWRDEEPAWAELTQLTGCSCYCDEEAAKVLRQEIGKFPVKGIHFLDSGNYHYMSLLWMEKIDMPFRLILFDNHTDMQPPAFGGLLSCGGWAAEALEKLPHLQEVILIGPDQEAFDQVDQEAFDQMDPEAQKRVRFLSREKLRERHEREIIHFIEGLPTDLPYYLSVDKDVLRPGDASTSWSQGDMKLEELLEYLELIFRNQAVLGMDVCGECDPDSVMDGRCNDAANKKLLKLSERY